MKNIIRLTVLIFAIVSFVNIDTTNAQSKSKKEVVKIKTSAVCDMCKERIEKNIAFEKGVSDVVLDLDTKIATITYNPSKTNPDKLKLAITKLGHDADNLPADKAAYDKLPTCCKKDAKKH